MAEEYVPTLGEYIDGAICDYAAKYGGGMSVGYICIAERIDPEGDFTLAVSTSPNQPTHRSLGYATYALEWFKDDAVREMANAVWDAMGEEED